MFKTMFVHTDISVMLYLITYSDFDFGFVCVSKPV